MRILTLKFIIPVTKNRYIDDFNVEIYAHVNVLNYECVTLNNLRMNTL